MKTKILFFILFWALPASIIAQYSGGNGRGDFVVSQNNFLLEGEDGLYRGGIGRGEVALTVFDLILNTDIVHVNGSAGADGYYHSLTNASGAFSAINASPQTGRTISITLWGNSHAETGVNSLNAGTWTSLTIYPKITGLSVSGDPELPTIIGLNGADNVTIDGRLNASGLSPNMSFPKTKLLSTAINNFIKYCFITGDFYMTGTSSATIDGQVGVEGNINVESGSNLSTAAGSNLTITGTLTVKP